MKIKDARARGTGTRKRWTCAAKAVGPEAMTAPTTIVDRADTPGSDRQAAAPTYTLEEKRQEHRRAYLPWTVAEEERLRIGFISRGYSIEQLSARLGRNPGAIRSRLERLGLTDGR